MKTVTDEMADEARQFILYATDMPGRNYDGAREHMRLCGKSTEAWPDYAKTEKGHLTKGGIADIIWHMMASQHPALHASAPEGLKCADCTMGKTVACPDCYTVWWKKENPCHYQHVYTEGPMQGHNAPCYYCKETCNAEAGNPGLWPIPLCHRDAPGKVRWHHVTCVTDRLVENQATADDKKVIVDKLLLALPYLRCAVAEAKLTGQCRLGILANYPDGSGKVTASFDADFIDEIAALIDAPPQTEADNMRARAEQFIVRNGLRQKRL